VTTPSKAPQETVSRLDFCRLRLKVLEAWTGTIDITVYLEIKNLQDEIKRLTLDPG